MNQLTFTDIDTDERQAAFDEFHRDNPQVWRMFERFAFEAIRSGAKRIGARLIWERMRWETRVVTNDSSYRLNDHWPPFYARLFMERYPQHGRVFETRGDR